MNNFYEGKITAFSLLCICFAFLYSCKENNSIESIEHDPSKPVKLKTFMPLEGGVRNKILLDGENFGSDPSKIKVYFNHARAPVVSSNGNRLYALVPRLPGDDCIVSVVVGNDSLSYEQTFKYHTSASVSTITGNGQQAFRAGTLAQAQVYSRYICVDEEKNIFATVSNGGSFGFIRINEKENIVEPLTTMTPTTAAAELVPNAPAVDLVSGVVTVPNDKIKESYFTFDPKERWAPRSRVMKLNPDDSRDITVNYKYAMVYSPYDGHLYSRYGDGSVVKTNPETYESTIVYKTNSGAGYGLAVDPNRPYLLYFTFHSNVAGYGHSICTLDLRDPSAPGAFKKISSSTTTAGHEDGLIDKARFNLPRQLAFDLDGNLFIADFGNHCIRMMSSDNVVKTVVGHPGVAGMQDGGQADALFNNPWGLAVTTDGSVYIADFGNARIRKLVIE